jgi:hypothetical protein
MVVKESARRCVTRQQSGELTGSRYLWPAPQRRVDRFTVEEFAMADDRWMRVQQCMETIGSASRHRNNAK